jgi:serine/threonine-protein kinase
VAIKFLSPELADDDAFRERFVRESRLAAAIEHPAIVPIYEAGTLGASLFIAMRFIPGQDLGRILRAEAPFDVQRTLGLVTPLADALDTAHRRGLVHRDVKPANVLVERDGIERPYLTDFGLSRRLGDTTLATRSGPLGTIDYVAPEQVGGGSIDGRVDQYALACLVVHCLTGAPPFRGESDAAVLFAQLNAPPPRIGEVVPALRGAFEASIARALSKDPAARYPDCHSFVAALVAATPVAPATTTPPGARDRPAARPRAMASAGRRGRTAVIAATGVVGVVAVTALALLIGDGTTGPSGLTQGSLDASSPAAERGSRIVLGPRDREVIVFASDRDGDYDLYALEAGDDTPRRLGRDTARHERSPAVSPDGTTIAFTVGPDFDRDIWLMDSDGGRARPVSTHPADEMDPAWSSDGSRLAFASRRSDIQYDIWEIRGRDGVLDPATARNLTDRPATEHLPAWVPETRNLLIASNQFGGNRDILRIDSSDRRDVDRLTSGLAYDFAPDLAPDGDQAAFFRRAECATCSNERGQADLMVMAADGAPEHRLTRTDSRDEIDPDWAPDGRALVYAAGPFAPGSGPAGASELMVMSADGQRTRRLTDGFRDAIEPSWGVLPQPGPSPVSTSSPAPSR